MEHQVIVVQRDDARTFGYAVTDYIKLGWEIYGPPFILGNNPSQIVIKTDNPAPTEPVEYRLVIGSVSTLQAEILGMLQSDWKMHSELIVVNNQPAQAMLKGPVKIYGDTSIPSGDFSELVTRLAQVETLANTNKTNAVNITAALAQQTSRITTLDGAMVTKANLVDGKVPYEELPDFPVGRKVSVADEAARLALSVHSDLTIAYEQDTADAWALNPDADPSVSANWTKLGNAQATGVITFNGRAGNIAPQAGDYNTNQITETLEKRFVTTEQIGRWDSIPDPVVVDQKIAAQKAIDDGVYETKVHAEATFAKKSDIPDVTALNHKRVWRNVKSSRTVTTNYKNDNDHEMVVRLRSAASNTNGRYMRVLVYNPTTPGGSVDFRSDAQDASGYRWFNLEFIVPARGSYTVTTDGSNNTAGVEFWYELS